MKQLFNTIKLLAFIALLPLLACEREAITPPSIEDSYAYFPLTTGNYWVYQVDDIRYNFAAEDDTLAYEVKEWITDSYLNESGDSSYVIEKLSRFPNQANWKLDSITYYTHTADKLIAKANNQPIVQLIFPVEEDERWNSHMLSNAPADTFEITEVNVPYSTPAADYSSSMRVVREDLPDPIVTTILKQDVYVKDVGLVYQENKVINYCATVDCAGQGIITSGYHTRRWLIEQGREMP